MSKICFVCPDLNTPAGGIKQIFRQVHALNAHGKEAYIVHGDKNFNITWFEHQTPTLYDPQLKALKPQQKGLKNKIKKQLGKFEKSGKRAHQKLVLEKDDVVVLPEFYGSRLDNLYPKVRTVIYNQNCYYTFRGYGLPRKGKSSNSIYTQDRLEAVIVASEDAVNYMTPIIGDKPIYRVFYGMDHRVFSYQAEKQKKIAFMPRKLNIDAVQVLNILH
ncbi:MAG: glycosyltransferase family 1 protein, partial [Flavobacteriaceae bacterium]|nr:glycosyltransferase family 1 protein [Flavobacteriaceae bacterium]